MKYIYFKQTLKYIFIKSFMNHLLTTNFKDKFDVCSCVLLWSFNNINNNDSTEAVYETQVLVHR